MPACRGDGRSPSPPAAVTAGARLPCHGPATVTSTVPQRGASPRRHLRLVERQPKQSARPSTSPVERISGPRRGSTSGNMLKGKTASFTPKWGYGAAECPVRSASPPASPGWRCAPWRRRSPSRRAARCAMPWGSPRARRPCRWRWHTGCSSGRPRSAPTAMRRVYSDGRQMLRGIVIGGSRRRCRRSGSRPARCAPSPRARRRPSPSAMASASASMAFSRNLSIRIGRSGETSTAAATYVREHLLVVDHLHAPPAEHVGRAHHQRIADPPPRPRAPPRRSGPCRAPAAGCRAASSPLKPLAVFGQVDALRRGAQDPHARRSNSAAILSGVWPPNWTMTPSGCSFS